MRRVEYSLIVRFKNENEHFENWLQEFCVTPESHMSVKLGDSILRSISRILILKKLLLNNESQILPLAVVSEASEECRGGITEGRRKNERDEKTGKESV